MVEYPTTLDLWRFAARLFYVTRQPPWEGPFRLAGYVDFRVAAPLFDKTGQNFSPDITAVAVDGWLILDVTANGDSKKSKVADYSKCESRYLGRDHGLRPPNGNPEPDLVVLRKHTGVDDGCAQVVLTKEGVQTSRLELIHRVELRQALERIGAIELHRTPSLPITIAPESRVWEVREGLVPSVMELMHKPTIGFSIDDLLNQGLDFLADRIAIPERARLIEIVKFSMEELVAPEGGLLCNEIVCTDGNYHSIAPDPPHHRSLGRIEETLRKWVLDGKKPRLKPLNEYSMS